MISSSVFVIRAVRKLPVNRSAVSTVWKTLDRELVAFVEVPNRMLDNQEITERIVGLFSEKHHDVNVQPPIVLSDLDKGPDQK